MRLKQIEIEGFRGFSKVFQFDLDGNIILLAGNNGLGKTTFFDAIEWCLTGALQRYEKSRIEQREHPYIVNRFYNGKARVKLFFNNNSQEIELTRIGDEAKTKLAIKVDGKSIEEKEVMRKKMEILIGDSALIKQIREKDLPYLLLRSHLLSQEHTAEFIRTLTPTSRFSQLSKILGTDRFETFYKKIVGTYKYIEEEIRVKERELEKAIDKIKERKKLLREETKLTAIPEKIKDENEYIKERLSKLHTQAHKFFPNLEFDKKDISFLEFEKLLDIGVNYCTQLTFKIDDKVNKTKIVQKDLNQLARQYSNIDTIIEKDNNLLLKLKKTKENLTSREERTKQQKEVLSSLQTQNGVLKLEVDKIIKEINLIKDLKENVNVYIENKKSSSKISEDIKSVSLEINNLFSTLKKLNEDLMKLEQSIKNEEDIRQQRAKIKARWTFLKDNCQIFLNHDRNVLQLTENSKRFNEKSQNKLTEIKNIEVQLAKLENFKKSNEYELNILLARFDEHKQLLSKIKDYIKGPDCPTCGYDWRSEETLRKQIDKLSETQDKEVVLKQKEVAETLSKIEEFNKHLLSDKTELAEFQKDIKENQSKLDESISKKNQLIERLFELEINPDSIQEYKQSEIIHKLDEAQSQLKEIEANLSKLYSKKGELGKEISTIEGKIRDQEKMKAINQKSLSNIQQDIIDYEEKIKLLNLQIDNFTTQVLENLFARKHEIMSEIKTNWRNNEVSLKKTSKEFDDLSKELSKLQEEYNKLATEKTQYEANIKDFQISLNKFHFVKYSDIDKAIITKEEILDNISKLNQSVVEFSQILEYMSKRKRLHRLKKEISDLDSQKEKVEHEIKAIKKARKFAGRLNRSARRETANLVDKLIKGHELLINTFYGQINAHPLFKTIHFVIKRIKGRGGGNAVFIEAIDEYGEKRINPSLTFSSAQLNVLAISIFLAIHRKQTWSTLDSIFMDDPIQNMDDLNILSYIDLIRRICKDKQIIISTHDDNIYHLIRRKLYPLSGEKTICYEYKNFGEYGPEIEKNYILPTQ